MKSLREQLTGVPTDSPSADPEPEDKSEELEESEKSKVEDSEASEEEESKEKGRNLENVRGELLRKQEKALSELRNEVQESILGLKEQILEKVNQTTTSTSEPKKDSDSLDNLSIAQLEGYRDQIPDEKKAAFEAYVQERKVSERVDNRLSEFEQNQDFKNSLKQHNTVATERYPDLKKPRSKFAKAVEARLKEYSDNAVQTNPRLLLDIANGVAIDQKVEPKTRRVVTGYTPAPTDSEPSAPKKSENKRSDEELAEIATSLQSALPKGKKFDMKRVKKRASHYTDNIDDYVNKKGGSE